MRIITSEWMRLRACRIVLPVIGAGLVALVGLLPAQSLVPTYGLDSIRIDELRTKVSYLSSDDFRGRGNGTPELDEAARYIAGVFEENGLSPVGSNGYFQDFEVERLSLGEDNALEVSGSREIRMEAGRDFIPFPGSVDGVVSGSLLFVGYGIRAPQLGYDDLESVRLDGQIAVALEGHPGGDDPESPFNALSDQDFSDIFMKARNVEAAGAVGLIVVQGPLDRNGTSIRSLAQSLQPNLSPRRSLMRLKPGPMDPQIPIVLVSRSESEQLVPALRSLQLTINDNLRTETREVSGSATLQVEFERDGYTARNVIAQIEGSDPDLRDEAIVVGAHYDHDGEENGRIWNGADDNASGTSGLLELAEAFSAGVRPGRSVLLSAWAAEEKGMLGSRHYVQNAPIPLADTVAMFQIDMIGRNEEHGANRSEGLLEERASENGNMLNVLGSLFSPDMRQAVEQANSGVGLELRFRYDYGAQNMIRRSDHWSFLTRRVPALFLFGGIHPDYHTPSDTADKINYSKLEKVVKLVYLAVLEIGDQMSRPRFTNP